MSDKAEKVLQRMRAAQNRAVAADRKKAIHDCHQDLVAATAESMLQSGEARVLEHSRPDLPAKDPEAAKCPNCDGYGKGIEGKYGREFPCPDCKGTGKAPAVPQDAAKPPRPILPRLPDQSRFVADYNAAKEEWTGLLMVPWGPGAQHFHANASSVRKLCFALDDLWRKWLAEQPQGGV
jgi:hypothetical protein